MCNQEIKNLRAQKNELFKKLTEVEHELSITIHLSNQKSELISKMFDSEAQLKAITTAFSHSAELMRLREKDYQRNRKRQGVKFMAEIHELKKRNKGLVHDLAMSYRNNHELDIKLRAYRLMVLALKP